jgi:TPR repeat protein
MRLALRLILTVGLIFATITSRAQNNAHPTVDKSILAADDLYTHKRYDQALPLYQAAANSGNAYAMMILGVMYENGLGVNKDTAKALQLYQKSASLGYSDSMSYVGWMYLKGAGVPENGNEALVWYKKAGNAGNVVAMRIVGDIYSHGISGAPVDKAESLRWYQKAADKGDAEAKWEVKMANHPLIDLNGIWAGFVSNRMFPDVILIESKNGRIYARRLRNDFTLTGMEYLRGTWNGEKQIDIPVQRAVYSGLIDNLGASASTSLVPADQWVPAEISIDDPDHISLDKHPLFERISVPPANDVYCRRENPLHVQETFAFIRGELAVQEKDYQQAVCWYILAAIAGHPRATSSLGELERTGLGMEKDSADALKYMEIAGDRGDYYGALMAAEMYKKGEGAPPNPEKAAQWLAKAKELKEKQDREEAAERKEETEYQAQLHALEFVGAAGAQMFMNELRRSPECDVMCSQLDYSNGSCARRIQQRDTDIANHKINCDAIIPEF